MSRETLLGFRLQLNFVGRRLSLLYPTALCASWRRSGGTVVTWNHSDTVFVTLFGTAIDTAVSRTPKLFSTGGVPTSLPLLFWRWLTYRYLISLFDLYGSECMDKLFIDNHLSLRSLRSECIDNLLIDTLSLFDLYGSECIKLLTDTRSLLSIFTGRSA